MDLCLDPMDGERDQAYALVWIKALYRLHQPDVAFLYKVGMGKSIAEIAAGDRDDQTKMRENQLARGFDIVLLTEARRQAELFLLGEDRKTFRCGDVGFYIAYSGNHRESQSLRHKDIYLL